MLVSLDTDVCKLFLIQKMQQNLVLYYFLHSRKLETQTSHITMPSSAQPELDILIDKINCP